MHKVRRYNTFTKVLYHLTCDTAVLYNNIAVNVVQSLSTCLCIQRSLWLFEESDVQQSGSFD